MFRVVVGGIECLEGGSPPDASTGVKCGSEYAV